MAECQLLPASQRIGDSLARNGLRQDRSSLPHLQQQCMQLRQDVVRTLLAQRMTIVSVRPGNTMVDGSWQPEIGYIAILPE